jgi:hypothetical protein
MFTRSRSGRRGSPARLNVEHLEDRFLPHGSPLAAGLVGPLAEAPAHADTRPDQPGRDVLARLEAAQQAGQAEHQGPAADQGHGKAEASEEDSPVQAVVRSNAGGASTADHSGPVSSGIISVLDRGVGKVHFKASDGPADSDDTGDKAAGATARKSHDTSDDDSSTSENSGRATVTSERTQATAPVETLATARSTVVDEGGEPAGAAGKATSADVGPMVGPVAAAGASDSNSTSQAPARPAAVAAAAPVVPLHLAGQSAAGQDGGGEGGPEAAPAAVSAEGSAVVLAAPDVRAAALAAHGQAGPGDDAVVAPLSGDVRLTRDGVLAEGAAPESDAPAAAPASYAAFLSGTAPLAGALLDRLALDTRALDEALQGFLRGLDRLGENLSDPRVRLSVSTWLLSGAAALAVLEVNRRRRAAAAADADGVPLTWLDPEGPAPEPAS